MNRSVRLHAAIVAAFLLMAVPPADPAGQEPAASEMSLLEAMVFRSIGPATMGGRIDDLAVLENQPSMFFAGAATGGLWKTVNNGTTWEPVFDNQDVVSIGAVAIPSGNPDLVWVGTGENNNRQSSSWGGGVFKSTDGGSSWKNMGLEESHHVGRILIDPHDQQVVYVAATGHLWGPNRERGIYKTTDGGTSWKQSLFVDPQTGATDIVMDPSDSRILYAAMYQRQRSAWGFNGGGPGSGLFKSTDAGNSWSKLGDGIPDGALGRIGLDICRSRPKIVVALIQGEKESGLYRSEDAGDHWSKMSNTNPRPNYFSKVRVDPNDPRRVYVLGVRLMISDDEGRTFKEVRVSYSQPGSSRPRDDLDVHAMWIDPGNPSHLLIGSDVGIAVSYDRGATWDYINNLPIGQFYHVGYDMDVPYRVYGGLQDNDVWGGPSRSRNQFGIGNRDWFSLAIGDGFAALADPRFPQIVYGETQNGSIVRINRETGERLSIRPQAGRGEPPLRWAWDTPFFISPHDPDTLLVAAQRVFRSTDRGSSWTAISPDLTSGVNRETLTLMGVKGAEITLSKNDGVTAYPAIVTLAESPRRAGLYYAGADDGTVQVSRDAGKTWHDLKGRFPGLPEHAAVSRIVVSAHEEGRAFATFNNHRSDDYAPYVYMTSDYGDSWTSLTSNLPANKTVNCITEDPKNRRVLYLGTEFGLFVTLDQGQHWSPLKNNLPTVPIDEITIHPRDNDMLLATHGRSIWILDNLAPIQQAAEALASVAFLFDLGSPALEFNTINDFAGYPGDRAFWGRNPEAGAVISYFLKQDSKDIRLSIRDARGEPIREWSMADLRDKPKAGLNRLVWDLRHQPLEGSSGSRGGGRGGGASAGPFVLPGTYKVALAVDGQEAPERSITVLGDPLMQVSEPDRRTHHDLVLRLHELQGTANQAAAAVTTAMEQVNTAQDFLKAQTGAPARISESAAALRRRLESLAEQLGAGAQSAGGRGRGMGGGEAQNLRGRLASLKNQLIAWTAAPTRSQAQLAAGNREELAKLAGDLNDILLGALPALYRSMKDANMNPPPTKPIPPIKM